VGDILPVSIDWLATPGRFPRVWGSHRAAVGVNGGGRQPTAVELKLSRPAGGGLLRAREEFQALT